MARAVVCHLSLIGAMLAWPADRVVAQPSSRALAVGLFAGTEFHGANRRPLFGVGVTLPLPAGVAFAAAASTVRYTGVYQLEAGLRWPTYRHNPVNPYVGAAACLLSTPGADVGLGPSWRPGALALGGLEVAVVGVVAFAEGVALTDGTFRFQARGGLRLQLP